MAYNKILIISYYFIPHKSVGAQRTTYWAQELGRYGYDVDVITAIKGDDDKRYNRYVVDKTKKKYLLNFFIKDEGFNWRHPLKKYLKTLNLNLYKAVIISGGPFMQFEIGGFIKLKSKNTLLILDYRDPFAINPRFNNSKLKVVIKKYFEKKFNKNADYILSVNQYCINLISGQEERKVIIPNGFDERYIQGGGQDFDEQENNIFIYTGKLYEDRNPEKFLTVMEGMQKGMVKIIGDNEDFLKKRGLHNYKCLKYIESVVYQRALGFINEASIGLIFTSGEPFESTTKIYDYIGLNKKILIITEGELKTGAIHEITKNYPNVVWAKNKEPDIKRAINKIVDLPSRQVNVEKYSRANALKKMVKIINQN